MWVVVGYAAAMLAGVAVRRSLEGGWRKVRKEDPPRQPASPETTWTEALLWSALTGMAVGVARVIARRGAASGWRRATGRWPENL